MKKFVLICFCVLSSVGGYAQNWDINTLHKINSLDSKFARLYSKAFSKSAPYIAVGVPVAMAVYAGIDKDKELLKDAIYIGTSVAEAVVITYGMKYAFDRERPYDRYPDRVDARSHESSPSFPSGHTAAAFSLATSLSIRYPKWYVIAPSAFWACSVGFSRMNEGVHYPSDVAAGAVIGAGCAVANIYVNRWLNKWLFGEKKKVTISYSDGEAMGVFVTRIHHWQKLLLHTHHGTHACTPFFIDDAAFFINLFRIECQVIAPVV